MQGKANRDLFDRITFEESRYVAKLRRIGRKARAKALDQDRRAARARKTFARLATVTA